MDVVSVGEISIEVGIAASVELLQLAKINKPRTAIIVKHIRSDDRFILLFLTRIVEFGNRLLHTKICSQVMQ